MNRIITKILIIIIASLGIYFIVAPFLPNVYLPIKKFINPQKNIDKNNIQLSENKIIIPKIEVNSEIFESDIIDLDNTLLLGPTRKYNSSDPANGGNTIIVAHRMQINTLSNSFFHLPKLTNGDLIQVIWDSKVYEYKVFETLEVESNELSIEDQTDDNILTLYTCTPITDFSKRFVVKAKLQEILNPFRF